MIKNIKINDEYEILVEDSSDMNIKELKKIAQKALSVAKRYELKDYREPISSFKTFKFLNKTKQGLNVVKRFEDLNDERMHVIAYRPFDETYIVGLGYSPDDGVWNQGVYDFTSLEEAEQALRRKYKVKEFTRKNNSVKTSEEDIAVKDMPMKAPEESVDITYTEKLKGGKNALTYSMIETAFKDRAKDDGKTFKTYVDVAIDNLKDDIKNAKYFVSGELKSNRRLLLEDYVKIEKLIEKAGLTDKLNEIKPLIDELSDKLDLNSWKAPKFKKSNQRQASKELRNKHRWDSKITKTMKPVFLCTKTELTNSYNDAKQGKLPEVFEANLEKVSKDMFADYDRINQGRDTYVEDPRINKTLPEIVDLYETALKYADNLEYTDYAKEFAYMLETIKKAWGLAGE